ncbi:ABC transporter substrate-binding protein [Roseibium salinum]|nr:ABC transporter substrate-binding protein [Roseibium salinum]
MTKSKDTELLNRLEKGGPYGWHHETRFYPLFRFGRSDCNHGDGPLVDQSESGTEKKAARSAGGIHDGNTSDSHDPGTYLTRVMIFLGHTHRSYLTMIMGDGSLGPDIADSWEPSPDAKQWTFKLTDKASFHSGKKVIADDVIASLNHHRGEDTTSAAKALLTDVEDITKDDDYTVVVKLSRGNADFPWLMTDYHLAICPANDDGTIDWQSGDGSGPYKIDSGEFGVQFNLSRHDGWHREGAYFDEVVMITLNDPNARQTALVTGDVDAVSLIELKTMALLQRNPNIVIHNIPSAAAITLPMFCDTAPFDNVDVRNALKLAMNRDDIIEKITFGAATKANDFHHSPAQPYWPEDIPQREYDPDQAKSLLKKAGAEGLSVSLSTADSVYAGAVDMAVLYAEHAKAAGININVVREPNDGYYSDVWLKKPFCLVSWGARPTPDVMYTLAYKEDAAWNESHWQNERFNELLLQAKAELDEERRKEMYSEMAVLAKDDGGTIIPFFNNFVYANSSKVGTPENLAASWENDGGRAASRWWFET